MGSPLGELDKALMQLNRSFQTEMIQSMKNMQATSQGGGTGGSAGDSFKNMEQSMEQNLSLIHI